MGQVGGSLGSYGDRCAACGRECLHRVLAVHVIDPNDPRDPVTSRVLPSCSERCDSAVAARAVRIRRGDRVEVVRWRLDGPDWTPDDDGAEPVDPERRARLAAGQRWFRPVLCGHRPRHVAQAVAGTASGATWTRWSCPKEDVDQTPAADARLVDLVEHPVAAWNSGLLRYDGHSVRRALHPRTAPPSPG